MTNDARGRRTSSSFADQSPAPSEARDPATIYGRLVVIVVLGMVGAVAAIAITIGSYFASVQQLVPASPVSIGPWEVLVSQQRPPQQLVLLGLIGIVAIGLTAVTFEIIATLMSINPRRRYLERIRGALPPIGSAVGSAEPSLLPGLEAARVRVTVLIPAHDEESSLPTTLRALAEQTRPADRIIVIADNCSDNTVQIARDMGHEALETVDNVDKKAGALNQALSQLLPVAGPADVFLVMDADTALGPRYIEVATQHLEQDPDLAAVGGVFFGEGGHGLLGQFQRNEYTRYSLQIRQRRGRVFVLTGTATMFRAGALLDVAGARGVFIPGEPGTVYDTIALTEDNELTLALKTLGATMVSPKECYVVTELMPSWGYLWKQRQRWQRGALENLGAYGFTRATLRYWGQQLGIGYGTVALNTALLLMFITFVSIDQWIWYPFWLTIGLVFLAERVITVWAGGWKARLLAALLLPELMYDVYLQVVFINCLWGISTGSQTRWGHVQHTAASS